MSYFLKKLHLWCFTGFWIRFRSLILSFPNKIRYVLVLLSEEMMRIRRPWKLSNFQNPPPPCPPTSKLISLPWPWTSNFKRTPALQMITNKFKENISKDDYDILSCPSFRPTFVFSINSLILSGVPLTSFHLHSCFCKNQ